jgi:hypothetical protein
MSRLQALGIAITVGAVAYKVARRFGMPRAQSAVSS